MHTHFRIAVALTKLLENQFKIGRFSFGIEPLLSLFPGFGDLAAALISFYIVWIGIQMRLPQAEIARMVGNIVLDFLIGLVPFLGDAVDFVYKANTRNLEIIKKYSRSYSTVVEGSFH